MYRGKYIVETKDGKVVFVLTSRRKAKKLALRLVVKREFNYASVWSKYFGFMGKLLCEYRKTYPRDVEGGAKYRPSQKFRYYPPSAFRA